MSDDHPSSGPHPADIPGSRISSGGEAGGHLFGLRLRDVLRQSALGPSSDGDYLGRYRERHTRFLVSLMNPRDERFTYDLRMVCRPDPEIPSRGTIDPALLCRIRGMSEGEAGAYARDFSALLHSTFPEYTFEFLSGEELETFLQPFPLEHVVSLIRRADWERLDTLSHAGSQRSRIGFGTSVRAPSPPRERANSLFHLFPFLPTSGSFEALNRLLLRNSAPLALSCRLRPTAVSDSEEEFLEKQIARCERAAQTTLQSSSGDLEGLYPTLREQAWAYQEYQSRLLYGLDDNAALVTLDVASPARVPVPLLDTLGSLVTRPAGVASKSSSPRRTPRPYLAGGYELVDRSDEPEATDGFRELEMAPPEHGRAPEEAGRLVHLFDSLEAFAVFRIPPSPVERLPGLTVQSWRTLPPPPELSTHGTLLGSSAHRGTRRAVYLTAQDRARHVYLVGQTGTGKTTLLKTMILDDMRAGKGLCVVDPHGDLFSDLLGKVPEDREDDVIVIDPTDVDHPVGLNPLEHKGERQRHFLVQEIVGMVRRLLRDEFGSDATSMAGPIFWQQMRRNLLLAMSDPDDPGTLLEFYNIFQEPDYWKRWLPLQIEDPLLERWVEEVLPQRDYLKPGSEQMSMGGYVGSKFEGFVFDPLLRNIFCQKRSTVNLGAAMDEGRIVLVNLAKGELTEDNARFLGMVLMAKLMTAAMERVRVPESERRDFHLYVDEFQSLATQSFVTLLSEARKFGLSLTLANQFVKQIENERIVNAIFGNVGTIVCFRVGEEDAAVMGQAFLPGFTKHDLANLPNWRACVSTLVHGQTVSPFTLSTIVDETPFREERVERVRELSRRRYARNREHVEREASEALAATQGLPA